MTTAASMVVTRIGGVDYPLRSVANCKTCQSPYRTDIENELIKGTSYAQITRYLAGMPLPQGVASHPSAENLANHYKNAHMPLAAAQQRALIERRANEIGRSIHDSAESLADQVTVAQMVVARGFARLQAGEINPDVKDLLAASKFLQDVDSQQSDGGLNEAALMQVLHVYMSVAQEFIPVERQQAYAAALARNPVLREIKRQQDEQRALAAGHAV